jgi:hypothetical protein
MFLVLFFLNKDFFFGSNHVFYLLQVTYKLPVDMINLAIPGDLEKGLVFIRVEVNIMLQTVMERVMFLAL